MNLFGFCSSEHNRFDFDFYAQKKKKIFITLSLPEIEKVKTAWGNLKPPIYDNRIIINVSRHQDFSGLLDKWATYHIKIFYYTTPKFSNKKAVLLYTSFL